MIVNKEETTENIAIKTLKTVSIIITVLSLVVAFFSSVHFNLETRVRILEIETKSNKKELDNRVKMFDEIRGYLIQITKELGNKKDRD